MSRELAVAQTGVGEESCEFTFSQLHFTPLAKGRENELKKERGGGGRGRYREIGKRER